jgi:hypothetical protein
MDFLLFHKSEVISAYAQHTATDTGLDASIIMRECEETVRKFTSVKTVQFGDFTQHTYSIATTKKGPTQFEDHIYNSFPVLVKVLSRGFSIVTKDGKIISVLEGPCKFSGKTTVDEDPEDEQETDQESNNIYDHSKLVSWSTAHTLEIIETEKANGKFVIFRAIIHDGVIYLHTGSKNRHLFFSVDELDSMSSSPETGDIVRSILQDVKTNLNLLTTPSLMEKFDQNYSLCGELCDGQHFVPGDDTISWFGLFRSGNSMETSECFSFIQSLGIKTVQWSLVYNSESKPEDLENVFLLSRCKMNEGSVLRCRNIETNEIILVKTKSVLYIAKRFMRQSILKGYAYMVDSVKKRFIDAQKYHGLNTDSSIKMCNQLVKFGFWLMNKEIPVAVLGVTQVNSIRGFLLNGFATYWSQFLLQTGEVEQVFTPEDFGDFDEALFSSSTEPYVTRNYSNPACVIFFQGLQGSGKSTLGQSVKSKLAKIGKRVAIVEQDRFYGCTASCQGYLYHNIKDASGPDVILVTRCNANPKQYERYLQICHKLPSVVTFVTPHCVDELYLAVSLSGVLNRSENGDSLLVGRKEYPIEEASQFIIGNYTDFECVTTGNKIHVYEHNPALQSMAKEAFGQLKKTRSNKVFIDWVFSNAKELQAIRRPISELTKEIIQVVHKTTNGENLIVNTKPGYVGLAVQDADRQRLIDFIKTHNDILDCGIRTSSTYVNHCTQLFLGGKEINSAKHALCKPLDRVHAKIDALVIRKSDGACSFRIRKDSLVHDTTPVHIDHVPHITGIIPRAEKPVVSNVFVGLIDSTVKVIPMDYDLVLIAFYA